MADNQDLLELEDESTGMSSSDGRERNFCFILYPDSAPENWQDIIEGWNVPAFVSPLHDCDILSNNKFKKPHRHVIVMTEGVKSPKQRDALIQSVKGQAPPGGWIPPSLRTYARYLCHLDSKNKHHYDTDLVLSFGGANYQNIINLAEDKYKAIKEMMDYCKENHITMYADLMDYAAAYKYAWYKALCDNSTMVMMNYLKSIEYKERKQHEAALEKEEAQRHIELLKSMNAQIEQNKALQHFLTDLPIEDEKLQ